jgi:SHS2 domain-containing protein
MGRFELFEHTADIGLRAYGKDLDETFAYAAKAVLQVVTELDSVKGEVKEEISITANDIEDLLTRWLSELLFLLDTKRLLLSEFEIEIDESNYSLRASAMGEVFDENRHEYKTEVKAITQHMLVIKRIEGGKPGEDWMVQVLLDI